MELKTQDARFAELEARAKAGDKEAEEEAQRMVLKEYQDRYNQADFTSKSKSEQYARRLIARDGYVTVSPNSREQAAAYKISKELGLEPIMEDRRFRLLPFTYDDAGNLIPLSERFQPSEPDIRRMAVEADKEQIKGEKIGPPKKTPEGIIAKTQELLRKQFDPSKVTEKNTT
jgi:hypothetical protein